MSIDEDIIEEEVPNIWEVARSDTAARVNDSERCSKKKKRTEK